MEKHQSGERLPGELGPQEGRSSALPSIPLQAIVLRRATASTAASQHNPFTSPPVALSGLPPTHMNSDNPYPTTSAPQIQISESRGTGSSSSQSSPAIDDIDTRLSSSTLVAQRTHDVPGEVWIDPLEREGLPVHAPIFNAGNRGGAGNALRRRSTWARGSRDDGATSGERHIERLAEHQAAGVVRAHTRRGWGWLHQSPRKKATRSKGAHEGEKGKVDQDRMETDEKGKATKHTHHRRRHTHSETENDTDFTHGGLHRPERTRKGVPGGWFSPVMHLPHMHARGQQHNPEDHHHGHHHAPKLGNGVLSALLALYGHDHEHDDEGSASGTSTPGGQSHASSDAGSEAGILPKPDRPWLSDQHDNHDHTTSQGPRDVKDKHVGKFNLGRSLKGGSASSILAHLRNPSLPAAPATAALIAGAGTLTGVAAPQQSTLAPNLKKAGYNLVRYSVDEVPKIVERTPNVIPRGLRRARSTDSGIATTDNRAGEAKEREADMPDTPAATIVASPTADSEGLEEKLKGGHDHPVSTPGGRKGWTGRLRDLPLAMHLSPSHIRVLSSSHPGTEKGLHTPGGSGTATPGTASVGGTPVDEFGEKDYLDRKHVEKETRRIKEQERKERKEREKQREKEIRRKRRKAEVFVRHPFLSVPSAD